MRIRAILEFQKPRASFASFANKFVYRGIAAGLVPPVSLRQIAHFLSPIAKPSLSQLLCRQNENGRTPRRRSKTEEQSDEGRKKNTSYNVENVKICAKKMHLKKKTVDSYRRSNSVIKARTITFSFSSLSSLLLSFLH